MCEYEQHDAQHLFQFAIVNKGLGGKLTSVFKFDSLNWIIRKLSSYLCKESSKDSISCGKKTKM